MEINIAKLLLYPFCHGFKQIPIKIPEHTNGMQNIDILHNSSFEILSFNMIKQFLPIITIPAVKNTNEKNQKSFLLLKRY